ncbi:MAG: sugar phosphate isomerase/epimerase [Bryobacteraceae bacterium]
MTRRSTMGLLAAAGAMAQSAAGKAVPLGVATTDFRDQTNASLAAELKSQRIRHIQLFFTQKDSNYWKYGQRSDLSGLSVSRAKEIVATYRDAGITVDALGVYLTLVHADAAERKANLEYFDKVMKLGAEMGIRAFLSEMGHYTPHGVAERVSYDWQDDVWKMAVATGKELARVAEGNGAKVLLEPIYRSLLASAKRTRVYLEEVGSKHVRAQLDPANLLEVNDLEEMFGQLKGWIEGMHAKDRKLHVTQGVAAGAGDLDYGKFVRLAAQFAPGVPLTVEYAGMTTYRAAVERVRTALREAGLREG